MDAIDVADAKARLSELIDRVEATMTPQARGAAEPVRSMRDGDRY